MFKHQLNLWLPSRTYYRPQCKTNVVKWRWEKRDWAPGCLLVNSCCAACKFFPLRASAIANWLPRGGPVCATHSRLIASVALIKRRTRSPSDPGPQRGSHSRGEERKDGWTEDEKDIQDALWWLRIIFDLKREVWKEQVFCKSYIYI